MTRLSTAIFAALLLFASAASWAVDTTFLQGLGDSHYHRLSSKVVGRNYHVYVMLPAGYTEQPQQDYPTIYLLDGGELFPLFTAYYRYLHFGEEMPAAIIVGISYGSDTFEGGNFRSTDYTAASNEREYWGGASAFQKVLQDEVFPLIENNYRSQSDKRIIFGHSLGGQFVLYTAQTEPDLFWGYIASNPALHRNLPFFLQEARPSPEEGDRPRLFVGSGSNDSPQFRAPALKWIEHWSAVNDTPWHLKTMTLEGHTHMSAPPIAFRQGMHWLFSAE